TSSAPPEREEDKRVAGVSRAGPDVPPQPLGQLCWHGNQPVLLPLAGDPQVVVPVVLDQVVDLEPAELVGPNAGVGQQPHDQVHPGRWRPAPWPGSRLPSASRPASAASWPTWPGPTPSRLPCAPSSGRR